MPTSPGSLLSGPGTTVQALSSLQPTARHRRTGQLTSAGCHGLDLLKWQPDTLTEGEEGPVNALMDVLIPKERQLFTRQLYLTDK